MSALGWLKQAIGGCLERNTIVAKKIAVSCDVTRNKYETFPRGLSTYCALLSSPLGVALSPLRAGN
jgi:hypothetical protein